MRELSEEEAEAVLDITLAYKAARWLAEEGDPWSTPVYFDERYGWQVQIDAPTGWYDFQGARWPPTPRDLRGDRDATP